MDVPILSANGSRGLPAGEIYIPGREYEIVAQLVSGDQVTIRTSITLPPDKVPNPFVAEHVIAQWTGQCYAQSAVTRTTEGLWVFWRGITAWQYVGPVDRHGLPQAKTPPS